MFHEDYLKAIRLACLVHRKSINQIDIQRKNKAFAIYLLQGSNITQFYLAFKGWANGDLNAVFRSKRFIDESIELADLFAVLLDDDRRLKRWFDDQIIDLPNLDEAKNRDIKDKILKRKGMGEDQYKREKELRQSLFQAFSKGVHPNFQSVVFNVNKHSHLFDYECNKLSYYPITGFDFATFILIPVLQSIISYTDIIPIATEDYKKIRESIDHIERLAGTT